VRKALVALPGVTDVEVDFESKTAKVQVDEKQFNGDAAVDALAQAGFDNSSVQ